MSDSSETAAAPAETGPTTRGTGIHKTWPAGRTLSFRTPRFTIRSLAEGDIGPREHAWFRTRAFRDAFVDFAVPETPEAFEKRYIEAARKGQRTMVVSDVTAENARPLAFLWVAPGHDGRVVQTHNFVGDPDWWGKGVVHEARAGLMVALFHLGAERIYGVPRADNHRAVRTYREQGFKEEGLLRRHYTAPDGSLADAIVFGMLKEEFDPNRAGRLPERARQKLGLG